MIALRLPEKVAIFSSFDLKQYQLIDLISTDIITYQDYVIIATIDKQVKVYKDFQLAFTLALVKKVKKMTLDTKSLNVYVCDKHGDMWKFNLQQQGIEQITKDSIPIQTNLAIPKCFHYFEIKDQQIMILGDSYCKIKTYNANIIDELLWIWVPFEGYLKQIIENKEELILLFKRSDEDQNPFFELYKVSKNELLQEKPNLQKVFGEKEILKQAKKVYLTSIGQIIFQCNYKKIQIYQFNQDEAVLLEEINGEITDIQCYENGYYLSIEGGQVQNNIIQIENSIIIHRK